MIAASAVLAVLAFALLAFCFWQTRSFSAERERMTKAFNEERGIWIRERRDLNTKIQAPQIAPALVDTDDHDDLPLPPDFAVDEDELRKAVQHLESVGYEAGPAT